VALRLAAAVLLALLGAAAVAAGAYWIYRPAGVVTAGVELFGLAYALLYIERQERQ
jgi:hypothetical protein